MQSTKSIRYLQYLSPKNFLIHDNFADYCTPNHPSIKAQPWQHYDVDETYNWGEYYKFLQFPLFFTC
ncbi:MAG: hypothetical protein WAT37_12445 [Saprospiraceae bacterium]